MLAAVFGEMRARAVLGEEVVRRLPPGANATTAVDGSILWSLMTAGRLPAFRTTLADIPVADLVTLSVGPGYEVGRSVLWGSEPQLGRDLPSGRVAVSLSRERIERALNIGQVVIVAETNQSPVIAVSPEPDRFLPDTENLGGVLGAVVPTLTVEPSLDGSDLLLSVGMLASPGLDALVDAGQLEAAVRLPLGVPTDCMLLGEQAVLAVSCPLNDVAEAESVLASILGERPDLR